MINKIINKVNNGEFINSEEVEELCFYLMDLLKMHVLTEEEEKGVKSFLSNHMITREMT